MSTAAQIHANQLNSLHSTGPQTPEGKARVAGNAVKHGLCAETPVITPQQRDAYRELADQWYLELHPRGAVENTLYRQIVNAAWKLQLAELLDRRLLEATVLETDPTELQNKAKQLETIGRHHARIERSFYKALREIRSLKAQYSKAFTPADGNWDKLPEQSQSKPAPVTKPTPEPIPEPVPTPKPNRIYDPATGKRITPLVMSSI